MKRNTTLTLTSLIALAGLLIVGCKSVDVGTLITPKRIEAVTAPGAYYGGKAAITDYEVLATDAATRTALVLCHLHTGRTHQIRVHMQHMGTPLVGDPIYGKPSKTAEQAGRLMLHA